MRKILPILLAVAVYLTPLYPIYAQTTGSTTARTPKAATATGVLRPKVGNLMEKVENKMASRSAAFLEKIAKFRDKTKASRVEKINNNLNAVNDRRTSHMEEVLDKIANALERIKAKTEEAASAGKDVSAIKAAITKLESEWAEADSAVKAQAEKDYAIVVNTESTIKTDASSARDSLRTDLQAAHTQVVEARQALVNTVQSAISSLTGGNSGTN